MNSKITENLNYDVFMQMSPWDFDQSPDGWRKFSAIDGPIKAAELIQEYILKNKDKILNEKEGNLKYAMETMYFHIGQQFASAGHEHWQKAIDAFNKSFVHKHDECWNAYVSATIGFLESNPVKVEDAIKTIETSKKEDKRSGNIDIVKNFRNALATGERDYKKIYETWPRG